MFASRRPKRQKAPSLSRQLAMLVVFFGLMLAPVGTNIATAYQADSLPSLAQDGEEETGEEEFPAEDPNAVQEDQNVVAAMATLTLVSLACPQDSSIDPTTADTNSLIATCPPGQASWDVSDSLGGYQAGFSNSPLTIPPGDVYVTEQGFVGPDEAVVSCSSSFYGQFPSFTTGGGSTQITLDPDDSLTCAWVTMAQAPVAVLTFNVWECPANYDPKAQGADATIDCTTPAPNDIEFKLADTDPMTEDLTQKTGTPFPGSVTFDAVPADVDFTITETLPPTETRTFGESFIWNCAITDAMGTTIDFANQFNLTPPTSTGNTLTNQRFQADTTYVCEWFIVPTDDTATGDVPAEGNVPTDGDPTEVPADTQTTDVPVDGDTTTLTITKYTCPSTFGDISECAPGPDGIQFGMTDSMGNPWTDSTGFSQPNAVVFPDLAAGSYTVTETVPDGQVGGVWSCTGNQTITQDSTNGPSMVIDLAGGAVDCDWINILPEGADPADVPSTDGEPTDLLVTKYTCAADFDPWSVDLDMLPASCAVGDDGITFDIAGPDGYAASSATGSPSAGTGMVAPGLVAFEGLAPGSYTITEAVPDGYVGAIVGCDGNATITQYSDTAPSAVIDLAGGAVACKWVNLPTGDTGDLPPDDGEMTTFTITKYTCPATFSDISECSLGPDGIQFDLTDTNGNPWSDSTGSSQPNAVVFPELAAGSYTITETVPAEISAAGIWSCSGGVTITQDSTNGPNAVVDLTGGDAACEWVNITDDLPPADGEPVDFAIKKYTCPADADVFNNDPDSAATGCEPASGITFTLEGPDDSSQTAVTGDPSAGTGIQVPGQAWFEGLELGTYTITETVPDGYVGGITLCEGGVTIVQDSSVSPSAVLELASGPASCDWVNFATEEVPPADIVITKYTCPAGYDTSAEGANPLADCTIGPDGITFNATGPNDYNTQTNTGDSIQYAVMFGGLEPGSYDIVETVPEGQTGFVWGCTEGASYLPYLDGPGVSIDVTGTTVECDWLNIPTEPTDLIIYKYTCPVAYDVYAEGSDPLVDCTMGPDGITFNAEGPNGYSAQTDTGDSIQYAVMFGGLEPGTYTVTETPPPGTTGMAWSCTEGTTWDVVADSPAMTVDLSSGTVECDWLNIPTHGTITINKVLCAEGYTPTLTNSGVEATDCATPLSGITFVATPGNAGITDANGQVILTVPFDQEIVVTETVPHGYGTPVYHCEYAAPNGGGLMQQPGEGASFTISALSPGTTVTCTVYNHITPPTDLIIYKWSCPEGYDPYASGADPYLDCEPGPNGIVFSATGPNGYYTQSQTGDSIQYAVMFGALGVGDYEISEIVPEGYIGLPWSCTEGTTWSAATEGVPSMLVSLTGGTVECDWLNIATYQHEVTVYKWVCPEGLDTTNRNYGWFSTNCTTSTDGIQFRLDHVAGSEYAYPSGGMVFWKPVPAGPIGIQEYMPDDYKNPAVFCSVNDGPTQQFDASGGYVYYEDFGNAPDRSNTFVCHWYNIPGGPGEITVYKWTCAPNYDPYAYGVDPYTDCKQGPNNVTFTATGPNGYNKQTKTGTPIRNAAQWTDLVPGNYTITETPPKDTASVFVWDCYGQRSGALRPTPLTVKPTVTVKVQAGDEITCHWFNVPKDPYGSLTVTKYECNTAKFVSEVDCHTYEAGQTFHLEKFNGKSWDVLTTATTGKNGRYTWYGLEPGKYWVVEHGRNWCHMTSEQLEKNGQALNVKAGTETVVKVYNCTTTPGKQPNKPPTKYPNTGVPPAILREDWRWTA